MSILAALNLTISQAQMKAGFELPEEMKASHLKLVTSFGQR